MEATHGRIWTPPYLRLTVGLVLTVAAGAFEALAVATTMPATVRDLGGLSLYGWAFSAFMLTNLIGITVAGSEADRQGPARPLIAGIALFAAGLLIAGLAPTMLVVVVGRAVQGFGAGVMGSVAYVAIGRGYPDAAKPRMLAILSTAWVVPGLVGPALAGLVTAAVGWRWVFLGLAPLPPIGAALALPALRELAPVQSQRPAWDRLYAAVRLAIGAGLALAALEAKPWPLAAVLLIVGIAVAGPALRKLLPPGVLRATPGLPAAIATTGLLNLSFFGVDAFVPLALVSLRSQSVALAGLPLTAATLGWTGGAWVQAQLAKRGERRRFVQVGALLIAVGIGCTAVALFLPVPALLAVLGWGIAGSGMGMGFSTLSLVVLEGADPGGEGVASASLQLANVLGSAIGTGGGGALIAALSSGNQPGQAAFAAQGACMLVALGLCGLASTRMPKRQRKQDAATEGRV